ncbi:MAG TPA: hypothetical protein VGN84_02180 [Solirubrobacterales bacterium]|jgi:hypothetical protein|nr:hypothetical protein [Solirubrobacterales bacterium]
MKKRTTSILMRGVFAAMVIGAVFAGSANAAPAWKFNNTSLTGSETIVGAAFESSMTIPGLTTKCENFLYKLTISNKSGTGEGSLTEVPLYNCTTNSPVCTVDAIAAEKLPWASHLTTVTSSNYIVIEGVKVAILYGGEECVLGETVATVTGTAGGLINNTTETATFNASSFSATKTKLSALGSGIEWNGVFPTEAFEWHREQALTVS